MGNFGEHFGENFDTVMEIVISPPSTTGGGIRQRQRRVPIPQRQQPPLAIRVSGEIGIQLPIIDAHVVAVLLPLAMREERIVVKFPLLISGHIAVRLRNWRQVVQSITKIEKLLKIMDAAFAGQQIGQRELWERLEIAARLQSWKDKLGIKGST